MAQFKAGSGESEDVKYFKQDLVWKRVNRRCMAYPTQPEVSTRLREN
jgi:hypothetical protein